MIRPNILFILMDATRYDHLSCNGYYRETTPNINRLAKGGVLFENAFSTSAWTPPSFASMITGGYPSRHNVTGTNLILNNKIVTLPQVLSENGYNTVCFSTTAAVNSVRGFDKGFDNFVEVWRKSKNTLNYDTMVRLLRYFFFRRDKYTPYMNKLIKNWVKNNYPTEKPFFIYAHYNNPHTPYKPPKSFHKKFMETVDASANMKNIINFARKKGGYSYMAQNLPITEEEFKIIRSWYDGEIAYLDFRINELIQHIKQLGLYQNTLIIIAADHGENFGEHGLAYHQFCLYDTLIHIPLIMHCPNILPSGKIISELVSSVDLFPTILELLNIDVSNYENIDGKSIASLENRPYHEHIFAEYEPPIKVLKIIERLHPEFDYSHFKRGIKCIRSKEFKYIQYSDGDGELYNVKDDPQESNNLAENSPDIKNNFKKYLEDWANSFDKSEDFDFLNEDDDEEIKKNLKSLGYL